jgi:Nucleotidyltransferase domain
VAFSYGERPGQYIDVDTLESAMADEVGWNPLPGGPGCQAGGRPGPIPVLPDGGRVAPTEREAGHGELTGRQRSGSAHTGRRSALRVVGGGLASLLAASVTSLRRRLEQDCPHMPVHRLVQDVVRAFLEIVDAETPDLIEGLYLTGSAALGDFRPSRSDIDFVAVTATAPGAAHLSALERVHSRLRRSWRRPSVDGIYVTWDDLVHDPSRAESRPYSHEGRFRAVGESVGNPVI